MSKESRDNGPRECYIGTIMEWSDRMNAAIEYVEANLAGDVDFAEAAAKAACSTFHFQRMFLAASGLTLGEYVRRRRLTQAASDLISGDARVIDIALKYGYESPDAFARAFRNLHGVTPTAARALGVKLTAYPRISFHIILKGGSDMDYRIIKKPGFTAAARTRHFTTLDGKNFVEIPKWWQEFLASPDCSRLTSLAGNKPGAVTGGNMLGLCYGPPDAVDFIYAIAVELPAGVSARPFEKLAVPAATWAVFDCAVDDLVDVTKRIFSEWFPSTGYEHDDAPEIEVYLPERPERKMQIGASLTKEQAGYAIQLWIPVIKKQ